MTSDIETIQRARGWEPDLCCDDPDCTWQNVWHRGNLLDFLPDPLADTPEGWWEFGQILKWATEWAANNGAQIGIVNALYADDPHEWHASIADVAGIESGGHGVGDFRAAIVAAIAAAVRRTSSRSEGSGQ